MEQVRTAFRSLTMAVCQVLEGQEIPNRPVQTVVTPPAGPPYVAIDPDRPALSDLRYNLTIGLLSLPEYGAAADAIEEEPELNVGIIVDEGGMLLKPEKINITRAFVTNFLWQYLGDGQQLDWNENRFAETFDELKAEVGRKKIVLHEILPLSNLRIDIDALEFGDEFRLESASISELERWINRDRSLPPFGTGPPQWDAQYLDRPAVLHVRRPVVGELSPPDGPVVLSHVAPINVDHIMSALRLTMRAPISIIFQEHATEGMMAFGGIGTSWGWSPPRQGQLVTLDSETAAQVIHTWKALQTSPNIDILRLPLSRWESSLTRPNLEDRLIDAWISLEALLLGVQEGELSFRASVRLAEFLGTNGADRQDIYDASIISYKWRNIIVHGSPNKKFSKRNPLQETVQQTTDRLRSALLKVLEFPGRFNPKNLDSDLLRRE